MHREYERISEPGDWRRKRRSGVKVRRKRKERLARKMLRKLKRGTVEEKQVWLAYMKERKWNLEQIQRWARGEFKTEQHHSKKSYEVEGVRVWERRGLL